MHERERCVAELREKIRAGKVLAIVGSGVSIGATASSPFASWTGLLHSGLERCVALNNQIGGDWAEKVRDQIESNETEDIISAAGEISSRLGAPKGGNFRKWLRETVGSLKAIHKSVPQALAELGVSLATTNYDGLLEEVSNQKPVSWQDASEVDLFINGGSPPGILHLHGYWEKPESIVLDDGSYKRMQRSKKFQNSLKALRTTKTLLFIGCGNGLADPTFDRLFSWARGMFSECETMHFRLCCTQEVEAAQKQHTQNDRISILPYGESHSDLAPFLRSLKPKGNEEFCSVNSGSHRSSTTVSQKGNPLTRLMADSWHVKP